MPRISPKLESSQCQDEVVGWENDDGRKQKQEEEYVDQLFDCRFEGRSSPQECRQPSNVTLSCCTDKLTNGSSEGRQKSPPSSLGLVSATL